MSKVLDHNITTGEIIEREMNADELAQFEADKIAKAARLEAEVKAAEVKAALLDRLGITEAEAKLLLS
jgi:hypothetical protein